MQPGDSIRSIFDDNLTPFRDMINVFEGDYMNQKISSSPAEILFVDLSKSRELNSKIISDYFSNLIPEKSILLHQDFHWPELPWIVGTMHLMKDNFELLHDKANTTRVWKLKKPIEKSIFKKSIDYDFSLDDQISIIGEFMEGEKRMDETHYRLR